MLWLFWLFRKHRSFLHVRYVWMGCDHCDSVGSWGMYFWSGPASARRRVLRIQWFAYQLQTPALTTARRSLFRLWLTVSRWLLPWGPRTHNMDPYGPVRFLNFLNFKSKGAAMSCLRPRHLAAAAATLKIVRRDFHDVRQGILRQMSYIVKSFVLIELFNNEISWKMKCIKSGPGRGWRLIPMSLFRQLRLFGLNIS